MEGDIWMYIAEDIIEICMMVDTIKKNEMQYQTNVVKRWIGIEICKMVDTVKKNEMHY